MGVGLRFVAPEQEETLQLIQAMVQAILSASRHNNSGNSVVPNVYVQMVMRFGKSCKSERSLIM